MNKYEFKLRMEELYKLVENGEFSEAQDMADDIDWEVVRDVRTLCMVSDVYKVNKRYKDARTVLSYAYRISPSDKAIVYSLCDLCLKCNELVVAVDLHNQYKTIAEGDPSLHLLSYKVFVAVNASSAERIEALENFQNSCGSYKPKWMYELAYLYHKYGRETDCVNECNMILSFFRSGKYVIKAIELKEQHTALSSEEEILYKELTTPVEEIIIPEVDVSSNSNMSLEKELAGSLKDIFEQENAAAAVTTEVVTETSEEENTSGDSEAEGNTTIINIEETETTSEEILTAGDETTPDSEEDLGNTTVIVTESEIEALVEASAEEPLTDAPEAAPVSEEEPAFDETAPAEETATTEAPAEEALEEGNTTVLPVITPEIIEENAGDTKIIPAGEIEAELKKSVESDTIVINHKDIESALGGSKIEQGFIKEDGTIDFEASFASDEDRRAELDELLTLEGDGQIGFVLQEDIAIEKQITGQMCIDDMLLKIAEDRRQVEKHWNDKMDEEVDEQNKQIRENINRTKEPDIIAEIEARSTAKLPPLPTKEDIFVIDESELASLSVEGEAAAEVSDEIKAEAAEISGEPEAEPTAEELFFDRSQYVTEESAAEEENLSSEEDTKSADEASASTDVDSAFAYLDAFAENAERLDELVAGGVAATEAATSTLETATEAEAAAVEAASILENAVETTTEAAETETEVNGDTAEISALDVMERMLAEEKAREAEALAKENADNTEEALEEEIETEETAEETEEAPAEEETLEETPLDDVTPGEDIVPYENESAGDGEAEEETEEPEISHEGFTNKQWDRYESFVQTEVCREQIKDALTKISHEANKGNTIIGSVDEDSAISLGKFFIEEFADREEITGKTVSVKASVMNSKNPDTVFEALEGGALIITNADELRPETLRGITEALAVPDRKIFVVYAVPHRLKHKFIMDNPDYLDSFTVSVDIEALDDDELVKLATEYAYNHEYSIDDMGNLALHTIISGKQTNSHSVTYKEVKAIVDKAIAHSSRPSVKHLFETIVGKRFDSNDMIILREKDFK